MEQLADRHQRFVQEYIRGRFNGTRAALRAGASPTSARQMATQWLARPDVQAAIRAEKARYAQIMEVETCQVLQELAILAFSDLTQFGIDDEGRVTAPEETPEATRAISSLKRKVRILPDGTREVDVEVRLWSKTEALRLLGQYLDLFQGTTAPGAGPGVLVVQGVDPTLVLGQRAAGTQHAADGNPDRTRAGGVSRGSGETP